MSKPIDQRTDLDGCNWTCPCGSSIYTSDGFSCEADQRKLKAWLKAHAPHTDGNIDNWTSEDGMRALSKNPGRRTRPISEAS